MKIYSTIYTNAYAINATQAIFVSKDAILCTVIYGHGQSSSQKSTKKSIWFKNPGCLSISIYYITVIM